MNPSADPTAAQNAPNAALAAYDTKLNRLLDNSQVVAAEQQPSAPNVSRPYFARLAYSDLMALSDKAWSVEDLLYAKDVAALVGESEAGKGFLIADLMACGAMGKAFAGRFAIPRPLHFVYLTEEGQQGIKNRMREVAAFHRLTPEALARLSFYHHVPQLFDPYHPGAVESFIETHRRSSGGPVDVLILDTLGLASQGADENSSGDMGQVMFRLGQLRDELDCTVLVLHHKNKNGKYRGSTVIKASVDTMLEVEKETSRRILRCEKQKDAEPFTEQSFKLVPGPLGLSARVEWLNQLSSSADISTTQPGRKGDVLAVLRRYAGTKFTAKRVSEAIAGLSEQQANNVLQELVKENRVASSLDNPDKKKSNRNPWVYWLTDASFTPSFTHTHHSQTTPF